MATVKAEVFMKKYRLFVCGENFVFKVDDEEQRLGFYTTVFIEAENAEEAGAKGRRVYFEMIQS